MASITWYMTSSLAGTVHQEMSETNPGAEAFASPATGWVVGTGATNHSALDAQTERASSTFTATTDPDGSPVTTAGAGDCLRTTNTYTGTFASANWEFHFCVRGITQAGAQDGRIRFRLLKGANADGSGATEITSGQQQASLVTNLSSSVTQDSTLTINPGAFSVNNEYIFVQIAWERTGAGGMTTTNVQFRIGNNSSNGTRVVSSNFTPPAILTADAGSYVLTGQTVNLQPPFGYVKATSSNNTTGVGSTLAPTTSVPVIVGDLVVVAIAERIDLTCTGVTDNLSNTWVKLPSKDSGNSTIAAYYSIITTAGNLTPTAAMTASANDAAIACAVYAGPFDTVPLGGAIHWCGDSATPYSAARSGVQAASTSLMIGYAGTANGLVMTYETPSGGAIDVQAQSGTGANTAGVGIASKILTSDASVQYSFSGTDTEDTLTGVAFFTKSGSRNTAFGSLKGKAFHSGESALYTPPLVFELPINVAVGDLIVVVCGRNNGNSSGNGPTTVSDNLGNTYTALSAYTTGAGSTGIRAYYSIVTTAGNATISVDSAAAFDITVSAAAYNGPFANVDVNVTPTLDSAAPYTTADTGTLAQADELVIAYGSTRDAGNFPDIDADSPFSFAIKSGYTGLIAHAFLAHQVVSSTSSVTGCTFTGIDSSPLLGIASFTKDTPNKVMPVNAGSYTLSGQDVAFKRSIPSGAGAYALSGQSVTLSLVKKVIADAGSYALTGQDTILRSALKVGADTGAYVLSGQIVTLRRHYPLTASAGAYTLNGQDVTLTYNTADPVLAAGAGAYVLTGQTTILRRSLKTFADAGSYVLSGQGVNFTVKMPADAGAYVLSGQAVTFPRTYRVQSLAGSYALSGQTVTTKYGHRLDAVAGSYVLSGQAVITRRGYPMLAAAGAYTLSGQTVSFRRSMVAAAGAYTLSGQAVTYSRTYKLASSVGAYSLGGQNVTLTYTANGGSRIIVSWVEFSAPLSQDKAVLANAGSYVLTGQNVLLRRHYPLLAGAGAYTLSGQAVNFTVTMPAQAGAYVLTGQAVTFPTARKVAANAGAYTLNGQAVTLTKSLKVLAGAGSYVLSGQTVNYVWHHRVTSNAGAYTLAGQNVSLKISYSFTANAGAYALSGQAVNLRYGHRTAANAGAYTLAGQNVTLLRSRRLDSVAGAYTLSGQDVTLAKAAARVFADAGAYTLSGQIVTLKYGHRTLANVGAYTLSGQATVLRRSLTLLSAAGAYTLAGQTITFRVGYKTLANAGAYTLSGQTVNFRRGYNTQANAGAYTLAGQTTILRLGRAALANVGTYILSGQAVTLREGHRLVALTGTYTLSGQTIHFINTMPVGTGTYSLVGVSATLKFGKTLAINAGAYSLIGQGVVLRAPTGVRRRVKMKGRTARTRIEGVARTTAPLEGWTPGGAFEGETSGRKLKGKSASRVKIKGTL